MNLLIEGNADFTKKDHIDFFHSLGAECWYTFDSSGFSCLNTDFDKVADRFVSILTKPGYPEHVLKQDIRTSVDLIKKSEKNPNAVARLALQLYLFKDYPWTITNEEKIARLEKITQKAIFDFHKTYIIPQNFVLVVVGNYDEETLHTQLETAFSNWTSTEPVPNLSKALLPDIKNPEPKQIKRELHEEQVLIVGQRVTTVADHPEDLALRLLETHLERKLFDVRDQTGICYVLAGNLIQGGHFKSKGAASIVALVAIDKVDQAIEAIKNTLQDMSEHGVTEEYLKTAKDTYLMRVAKSFSTNASYASMYGFLLSHNKSWDYLQQKTKRLQELPIEDVNNTAKKYLDPREWTFITVGRI
jgi:zinc protease